MTAAISDEPEVRLCGVDQLYHVVALQKLRVYSLELLIGLTLW
jgi:hypothetical protein